MRAAFEVFSAHGFTGGSLQDVADVVGMSQTSLLHYFPTKRDLLLAVLRRRDQVAYDGSRPEGDRPDGAPGVSLREGVLRQAAYNATVPGLISLYTVLSAEAVTDDNPGQDYVATRFDSLRAEYSDGLRALEARGGLRPGVDPDRAAASLVALWDGLQLQWLLAPDRVDVVQQLRDHFELILLPEADSDTESDAGAGADERSAE